MKYAESGFSENMLPVKPIVAANPSQMSKPVQSAPRKNAANAAISIAMKLSFIAIIVIIPPSGFALIILDQLQKIN
jgi:hypothetical protein